MEKIELKSWVDQIEKTKETIKESLWGDFLFGGLLVSGLFIFVDSFELSPSTNRIIGLVLFFSAIFLLVVRLNYYRIWNFVVQKGINKATKHYFLLEFDKALGVLDRLLTKKRNLKVKELWLNKANVFAFLENYNEVLVYLNKAISIDPHYKKALFFKAGILEIKNQYDEALRIYDKILDFDYKSADAWYRKAQIECRKNNAAVAIRSLRAAIRLNSKLKEEARSFGAAAFWEIKDLQEFKDMIKEFF